MARDMERNKENSKRGLLDNPLFKPLNLFQVNYTNLLEQVNRYLFKRLLRGGFSLTWCLYIPKGVNIGLQGLKRASVGLFFRGFPQGLTQPMWTLWTPFSDDNLLSISIRRLFQILGLFKRRYYEG